MQISGGPNSQINQNIERMSASEYGAEGLDDILEEDIDLDEFDEGEDQDIKQEKGKKAEKIRKKKLSKKPTAIQLANKELEAKDLFKKMAEKSATLLKQKSLDHVSQKFQNELKKHLQETTSQVFKARFTDVVSISEISEIDTHIEEDVDLTEFDDDSAPMKKTAKDEVRRKNQVKSNQIRAQQQNSFSSKSQEVLSRFMAAFSESFVNQTPEKKEKVRLLRQALQEEGIPTKKITEVQQRVQQVMSKDLKKQLKNRFLDLAMSYNDKQATGELLKNYQAYDTLLKHAKSLGVFGFSQRGVEDFKEGVKEELRGFITSELDRSLVEVRLNDSDPKELIKVFDSFNNLAGFAKFNPQEYMKYFHQKLDNMGLNYFYAPKEGVVDNRQGQGGGKKKKEPDYLKDEGDEPEDILQALYIKKSLAVGPRALLKATLSVHKYEKFLKKIGKGATIEKIKQQSVQIAKLRLLFSLRVIFEEKATLSKLEGPKYQLVKKNMKITLKKLKTLGHDMPKGELKALQDQANRSMFGFIKEEYIKFEVREASNPKDSMIKLKKKDYLAILNRLKEESNIREDIKPKLMQDLSFLSDLNIVEAA